MKLHLEASPSELTTESVESLSERIKGAASLGGESGAHRRLEQSERAHRSP